MDDIAVHCRDRAAEKINAALGEMDRQTEHAYPEKKCLWLIFSLENTRYAVRAGCVQRVAVLYEVIPFKSAPAYCSGIMCDRNGMIRLLDLRVLFGQGYYRSAMTGEDDILPMIIVIELNGQKRGIIVDNVIAVEYISSFIEHVPHENCARSQYIHGAVTGERFSEPAPVICPDSFQSLELEPPDARIDWNSRIDIRLLAKKIRENSAPE